MTTHDVQGLYDYDSWANRKLLAVVSQLTSEQFTRHVAGAYGSIRNTLVHAYSAEWGWLARCGGAPRGDRLDASDYPTVESLAALWGRIEAYIHEFLSGLTADDLVRAVDVHIRPGSTQSMAVGELMMHGAMHAVHHRGQAALLLRSLGFSPGNFDLLLFREENRS
jgi:uncharacterized damage-inducible protein DinB